MTEIDFNLIAVAAARAGVHVIKSENRRDNLGLRPEAALAAQIQAVLAEAAEDRIVEEPEADQFQTESPLRCFTHFEVHGSFALGKGFRPSAQHLVRYIDAIYEKEDWHLIQILGDTTGQVGSMSMLFEREDGIAFHPYGSIDEEKEKVALKVMEDSGLIPPRGLDFDAIRDQISDPSIEIRAKEVTSIEVERYVTVERTDSSVFPDQVNMYAGAAVLHGNLSDAPEDVYPDAGLLDLRKLPADWKIVGVTGVSPALSAIVVAPDIPDNVYYHPVSGEFFYCDTDKRTTPKFWQQWTNRRSEFPSQRYCPINPPVTTLEQDDEDLYDENPPRRAG